MNKLLIFTLLFVGAYSQRKAITVLIGSVKGTIRFTEKGNELLIEGKVEGLTPGKHGFHIHALGDLTDGCTSTGSHFNPYNKTHGAPNNTTRHVGDLGNVIADKTGVAVISMTDKLITLDGQNSILGRAVVVHADEDDLGLGGHDDSLTTGHAGARVGCGVIGTLNTNGAPIIIGLPLGILFGILLSLSAAL